MRLDAERGFYVFKARRDKFYFAASIAEKEERQRMSREADLPSRLHFSEHDGSHPKRINFRIFTGAT